jgi:hypothetical protein
MLHIVRAEGRGGARVRDERAQRRDAGGARMGSAAAQPDSSKLAGSAALAAEARIRFADQRPC